MLFQITYTKEPHKEFGFTESFHKKVGETVVTVTADSEKEAIEKAHLCVNRSHMIYYSVERL